MINVVDGDFETDEQGECCVKVAGTNHSIAFGVDWKDPPVDVVSRVNDVLKDRGIDLQFTSVNTGNDCFVFIIK